MTEIDSNLDEQLMDIIFGDSDGWEKTRKDDLDNCGGVRIRTTPENATKLNEVESFTADVDVTGYISYTYKRKNNERS